MEFIRSFLSSLIILLAIPLLLVGTLSFTIKQTVLSESYVGGEMGDPRIFEGLAALVKEAVEHGEQDSKVTEMINREITPDRVRQVVQPAMEELFQYFQDTEGEELIIDLKPLKNPVKAVAPKDKQQELDLVVPDTINLAELDKQRSPMGNESRLVQYKAWYQRVQWAAVFLPLIVLGLLVLLFLINTGRRRLLRPAHVVLVSGVTLAAIGGLSTYGLPVLLRRISGSGSQLPPQLQEATSDLARNIGGDITRWILLFGVSYIVAAAVLFILAIVLFREKAAPDVVRQDRTLAGHT